MVQFWNAGAKQRNYLESDTSDSGLSSDSSPSLSPTLLARNSIHDKASSLSDSGSIVTTLMFKATNLGYMSVKYCEQDCRWHLSIFETHEVFDNHGERHPCKCLACRTTSIDLCM